MQEAIKSNNQTLFKLISLSVHEAECGYDVESLEKKKKSIKINFFFLGALYLV